MFSPVADVMVILGSRLPFYAMPINYWKFPRWLFLFWVAAMWLLPVEEPVVRQLQFLLRGPVLKPFCLNRSTGWEA
jgi:hypothetical protein